MGNLEEFVTIKTIIKNCHFIFIPRNNAQCTTGFSFKKNTLTTFSEEYIL